MKDEMNYFIYTSHQRDERDHSLITDVTVSFEKDLENQKQTR